MIEETWRITAKTVISEPFAGNPRQGIAPRQGIYDYECVPTHTQIEKPARAMSASKGGTPVKGDPIMTFRRITR